MEQRERRLGVEVEWHPMLHREAARQEAAHLADKKDDKKDDKNREGCMGRETENNLADSKE